MFFSVEIILTGFNFLIVYYERFAGHLSY